MRMTKPTSIKSRPRPFIKWAGSKTRTLGKLDRYVPEEFDEYFEPFLGSGALFFHLVNTRNYGFKGYLSDKNEELINTFIIVRDHVEELIESLRLHQRQFYAKRDEYYYKIRDEWIQKNSIERASRMLFLNKTCYNGLYRVNKNRQFNVPIGTYKRPKICNETTLRDASEALQNSKAEICTLDYHDALKQASQNDFIYLDPPYQPTNPTSNFTSYTEDGFTEKDQRILATVFSELTERGCKVLLSNSDTRLINKLYFSYKIDRIKTSRTISCKGEKRKGYTELIISN